MTDDPPFELWYNHCFLKQHSTSLIKPYENCFGHDKIRINVEKRVGYKRHSISATATKNDTKKMPQEDPEERLMYRNTMCLLC